MKLFKLSLMLYSDRIHQFLLCEDVIEVVLITLEKLS